jgi:peptide/nickel transport system permease protein
MLWYVVRRLAALPLLVLLMSLIIFGLTQALPGNVAQMILGQYQNPEALAALEAKLGLKDPLYVQYGRWFGSVIRGQLGDSLVMDRPIAPILVDAFLRTLALAVLSIICVSIIGIGLGLAGAVKRGSAVDYATALIAFSGFSVPQFFTGIVLIVIFSGTLRWLPSSGFVSFGENPIQWARHLVLPVVTLTCTLIAHIAIQTRSSLLEVLESTYIRGARARGLVERVVLLRHALPNALLPTITILALNFGYLMGEVVVVETVFAYPGMGSLLVYALQQRDLPLIQACILVVCTTYVVASLAADVLYAYFNPRIRYSVSGG